MPSTDQNQNIFYFFAEETELVVPLIGNSFGCDFLLSPSCLEQDSFLNKTHFWKSFGLSKCVFLVKKCWVKNSRSALFLTNGVWLLKFTVVSRGWACRWLLSLCKPQRQKSRLLGRFVWDVVFPRYIFLIMKLGFFLSLLCSFSNVQNITVFHFKWEVEYNLRKSLVWYKFSYDFL